MIKPVVAELMLRISENHVAYARIHAPPRGQRDLHHIEYWGWNAVITDAQTCVTSEMLRQLLPLRRPRANPRVVKRKICGYQLKHTHHRNAPTVHRQAAIISYVNGIGSNPPKCRGFPRRPLQYG